MEVPLSDNAITNKKPMVAALDEFLFLKEGYSFWKHLVPFSVAALLLIVLTLPSDNLLLNLVKMLEAPNSLWIPAGLLTVVASLVYVSFLHVQIRKAYLWTDGSLRRTLTTGIFYLLLCAFMAFGVLQAASPVPLTWSVAWACILLAALSLTGIGWSQPSSWVESLGIQIPDYSEARQFASRLSDLVESVRKKSVGERRDVEEFLKIAENLRDQIEKNKNLEPAWARQRVDLASHDIRLLIEQTKQHFPVDQDRSVERFVSACNFKMQEHYRDFIGALQTVSSYWLEWKYGARRSA